MLAPETMPSWSSPDLLLVSYSFVMSLALHYKHGMVKMAHKQLKMAHLMLKEPIAEWS